jgi:uncharacterized protein (UPF0248 family)
VARRFLNELQWHTEKSLEGVDITYIHRGAPGDTRSVKAKDVEFEKSFIVIHNHRETRIPYHRVARITKGSEVLWKKHRAK